MGPIYINFSQYSQLINHWEKSEKNGDEKCTCKELKYPYYYSEAENADPKQKQSFKEFQSRLEYKFSFISGLEFYQCEHCGQFYQLTEYTEKPDVYEMFSTYQYYYLGKVSIEIFKKYFQKDNELVIYYNYEEDVEGSELNKILGAPDKRKKYIAPPPPEPDEEEDHEIPPEFLI